MTSVAILDTSIGDYNLGNEIIMEAVKDHLGQILPNAFFYRLPSQEIGNLSLRIMRKSKLVFLGGGNTLTSNMEINSYWGVNLANFLFIRNIILMGVGWWQYQNYLTPFTRILLQKVLSSDYIHSARDIYTEKKLMEAGFKNVLFTGCPSLWKISKDICRTIRISKANEVLFTLTDYAKDQARDMKLLGILRSNYEKLIFWPQGEGDLEYLRTLTDMDMPILKPSVAELTSFLLKNDCDYVGTRLHAGIRSLQMGRRSIIIGIDNRAEEMKKDCNLPVIEQSRLDQLNAMIKSSFPTSLIIPHENIEKWKAQFVKFDEK